jgi:hypothetical protein
MVEGRSYCGIAKIGVYHLTCSKKPPGIKTKEISDKSGLQSRTFQILFVVYA